MGSLIELAKRDAKRFVTSGGFEEPLTITTPDNMMSLTITGWATKHHISFDTDGNQVNTKNVHVTLNEDLLVSLGYPVRNSRGEVSLLKHLISFADSSKVIKNYVVRENYPDEVLGLIVLILGDYNV